MIDDDVELCALMGEFFASHGFELSAVHDGRDGLELARAKAHDVILLDAMLPGLDGFEVLRRLRQVSGAPVLMLTARADTASRIAGLEIGADDYITKPFDAGELVARVNAVLRRATPSDSTDAPITLSGITVHPGSRQVLRHGEPVSVTSIEFDILHILLRAAGHVVSRDDVAQHLYQRPANPFDRAIDVHIHHLRRKLGDDAMLIRTVRGAGYLFSRLPDSETLA